MAKKSKTLVKPTKSKSEKPQAPRKSRSGSNNDRELFVTDEDHDDDADSDDEEAIVEEVLSTNREGSPDNTDDPVRMYLMQMGQIPLLTRQQEVQAAKDIEEARTLFRHCMLATDYVLQGAYEALEQVRTGKLRLDRTIEVSVTNTAEKKRTMQRLGPNLITLKQLLTDNRRDYRVALNRRAPCRSVAKHGAAWCGEETRPCAWSRS